MTAGHADPATGHHVRVTGAVKRYGAVTGLAGVDLEVAPGRFLVLLGPSGSGKSTLARVLAGVERLDDGVVWFGDALVADPRLHVPPERRDLAMVFQDYALWPHLTAAGNVAYALRRRRPGREQARRATLDALGRVGLAGKADRYPHELSGGEQQRVALARAVVGRPRLLLFDEPLSNLDADLRERLRVQIATLTRDSGATAVYITHDQSEAFALADEVAVLRAGRVEQVGPPEEVYHRPATPFVARFTGLSGELSGRAAGAGEAPGQVLVRLGEHLLACRDMAGLRPGDPATVLVRPAATALAAPAGPERAGALPGTVIDVAYRGRGYDHVVDCAAGRLAGIHDGRPWSRGSSCRVVLDPAGCAGYREDAGEPRHPEDVTAVSIEPAPPAAGSAVAGATAARRAATVGGGKERP